MSTSSPGRHRGGRHRRTEPHRSSLALVAVIAAAGVGAGLLTVRGLDNGSAVAVEPSQAPTSQGAPRPSVAVDPSVVRPDRVPQPIELDEAPARRPVRPKPPAVPEQASGEFRTARGVSDALPEVTSYEVAVEIGLPTKIPRFAHAVTSTLDDPRSWQASGEQLTRTASNGDFRVVLASPETADQLCAPLDTGGRLSCRNGRDVVINAWRWVNGADSYAGDLRRYRRYVINHEVGHALGYDHQVCPEPGAPAPVMVQQTKGLQGCKANPWPAGADL